MRSWHGTAVGRRLHVHAVTGHNGADGGDCYRHQLLILLMGHLMVHAVVIATVQLSVDSDSELRHCSAASWQQPGTTSMIQVTMACVVVWVVPGCSVDARMHSH